MSQWKTCEKDLRPKGHGAECTRQGLHELQKWRKIVENFGWFRPVRFIYFNDLLPGQEQKLEQKQNQDCVQRAAVLLLDGSAEPPTEKSPPEMPPASHSDFIAWVSCRCLPFYNIITCVVCAWTIFRRYLRLFGSYWKIASCRWAAATTMDRIHIGGSKLFPRGGCWWDGFWGTLNSSFSFSSSSSWRSSWSLSWSLGKYLADSYLSCVSSLNKLFAFYEFVSMWWCSIRGPAKWVFEAIQAAVADTASLYRRNYLPTKKAKMSAISQSQQKAHICGLYLCGHRPGTCFLFRSH